MTEASTQARTAPSTADASSDAPFTLTIETPAPLSNAHEIQLLRTALAHNPGGVALREKLGFLLFVGDAFDEAIALYEGLATDAPGFGVFLLLNSAYLARETDSGDRLAETAARSALDRADTPWQRAAALAALGKALARQDRKTEARAILLEALDANPHNADACKRLVAIDFEAGDVMGTLTVVEALIDQGVAHPRLIVAQALALAKTGRIDAARAAVGLDVFLDRRRLDPPPGWTTIAAFNADIKAELARHPDIRFDRYGSASSKTWRIDQPAIAGSRIVPILQTQIQQRVLDYVARIAAHDAPWVRARPANALLHNWCVMTDAEGFEEWHVHQHGWLSGVYYVDVPPVVTKGTGREGCIAFGLPEDLVGIEAAAAYGEEIVRPENGMLMLFPSHTYHRTFAHGSDHRRICLAFDIKPLD